MSKKTIWMNEPLEQLREKLDSQNLGKKSGRAGGFSQRLGDIVERYELIMKLTTVSDLSDSEKMILGEVVCGSAISATSVKWLHDSVLDCSTGTDEERQALYAKIGVLSPADRIAIIESLGL